MTTVPFKIKRQFGPDLDPYWKKFEWEVQTQTSFHI